MNKGELRVTPERIQLRHDVVRLLVGAGWTDGRIAQELGVTPRTILRDRKELRLPPAVPRTRAVGPQTEHGTESRYGYQRDPCRCPPCRAAHAAYKLIQDHEKGRSDRYYVTCTVCGRRHHVDDPNNYQCTSDPTPRRTA